MLELIHVTLCIICYTQACFIDVNIYTNVCTHIRMYTHVHNTHTHTHTHKHRCTHTYIHILIHTQVKHIDTNAQIDTHVCAQIHK